MRLGRDFSNFYYIDEMWPAWNALLFDALDTGSNHYFLCKIKAKKAWTFFGNTMQPLFYQISRAGHAKTLPRQREQCFRPKNCWFMTLCLYSLWQLHLDTEAFTFLIFFSSLKLHYVARCRCREAKKCRMSSSADLIFKSWPQSLETGTIRFFIIIKSLNGSTA